jgi:type II secretory pathway pseudopilin PulG
MKPMINTAQLGEQGSPRAPGRDGALHCLGRRSLLAKAAPRHQAQSLARMRTRSRTAAFSLIEILVVVSLLTIIILGLTFMFSQTQKALLSTTTQVDFLESGRAAADLLRSDLEQITPLPVNEVSFLLVLPPHSIVQEALPDLNSPPELRTNVRQWFFFFTRYNLQWNAIAYCVGTTNLQVNQLYPKNDMGVGSLYRTNFPGLSPAQLVSQALLNPNAYPNAFQSIPLTNMSRIADGIVHLQLHLYDTNGILVIPKPNIVGYLTTNAPIYSLFDGQEICNGCQFVSNAVPAFVEVELGVLENRTLDHLNSITSPNAAAEYLANHVGQVHMFRQRITIRNVDPSAYQ